MSKESLNHLVDWYEKLSPATLSQIRSLYAKNIHFQDPFRTISNIDDLESYFQTLFSRGQSTRFKITEVVQEGSKAVVFWNFTFKRGLISVQSKGSFFLKFDSEGKVCSHEDYWDLATQTYEQLPILGLFFRFVRWCISKSI